MEGVVSWRVGAVVVREKVERELDKTGSSVVGLKDREFDGNVSGMAVFVITTFEVMIEVGGSVVVDLLQNLRST